VAPSRPGRRPSHQRYATPVLINETPEPTAGAHLSSLAAALRQRCGGAAAAPFGPSRDK